MPGITTQDMHPIMARQLDCLARRDLDGLMENYAPDAALIRLDAVAQGLPEVRDAFSAYLALGPEVVQLTGYTQTDDVIFYQARMTLGGQPEDSTGTIVLRDGKIWRQTAAFGS